MPPRAFAHAKLGAQTALLDAASGATFQALRSSAALRWATSHPPRSGHAPHRALLEDYPSPSPWLEQSLHPILGIPPPVHIAPAGWALGGPSAQPRSAGAGRLRRLRRPAKLFESRAWRRPKRAV